MASRNSEDSKESCTGILDDCEKVLSVTKSLGWRENRMTAHLSSNKIICGVVVILVVALIVMVSILFAKNEELTRTVKGMQTTVEALKRVQDTDEGGLCFDCRIVENSVVGGFKLSDYFDVEVPKNRCCIRDIVQFMRLLNTVIYRHVNTEIIKARGICIHKSNTACHHGNHSSTDCRRPAAHLVRTGPQVLHSKGEGQSIREWSFADSGAFRQGIGYEDGRLVVQIPGQYYVYSQTYFVQTFYRSARPAQPENNHGPKVVWHSVYKYTDDLPASEGTDVLKHAQTDCWSKEKDFGKYTGFVGAVLNLEAGDQLGVKISNVSLVPLDTTMTYFGMYMV